MTYEKSINIFLLKKNNDFAKFALFQKQTKKMSRYKENVTSMVRE